MIRTPIFYFEGYSLIKGFWKPLAVTDVDADVDGIPLDL